jgi:acetyltransferase
VNIAHDALVRYCQVDYDRDLAFLAVVPGKEEEIIGEVRLNRFVDLDNAELSFVVGEDWQGRGIGSILMEYCIEVARDIGIKRLWLEILKENTTMIRFGRKYGFLRSPDDEDGEMIEMTLSLT